MLFLPLSHSNNIYEAHIDEGNIISNPSAYPRLFRILLYLTITGLDIIFAVQQLNEIQAYSDSDRTTCSYAQIPCKCLIKCPKENFSLCLKRELIRYKIMKA